MQIVESSVWKVRTARLSLKSLNSKIEITLFPMIHVGEAAFFETVYVDAFSHDVALVEGVKSPVVRQITRSYRWIEGSEAINLKVQPPYPSAKNCRANIIHADLSEREFLELWLAIPIWLRLLIQILAPSVGLWHRWFGSRETLTQTLTLDDLPRREEILRYSPETAALTHAILHARDEHLLQRLFESLDNPDPNTSSIAIVYGALHMRAIIRELKSQYQYHVVRGDWITVFNY